MLERFHCAGVCVAVLMLKSRFVCVCLEGERDYGVCAF